MTWELRDLARPVGMAGRIPRLACGRRLGAARQLDMRHDRRRGGADRSAGAAGEATELWERLDASPATVVLILKSDHVRDVDVFVRRYGARAYGPFLFWRNNIPETELEPIEPGTELPGGLLALYDGRGRNETPVWLPEQRTIVFADALTEHDGGLLVWNAVARGARSARAARAARAAVRTGDHLARRARARSRGLRTRARARALARVAGRLKRAAAGRPERWISSGAQHSSRAEPRVSARQSQLRSRQQVRASRLPIASKRLSAST